MEEKPHDQTFATKLIVYQFSGMLHCCMYICPLFNELAKVYPAGHPSFPAKTLFGLTTLSVFPKSLDHCTHYQSENDNLIKTNNEGIRWPLTT